MWQELQYEELEQTELQAKIFQCVESKEVPKYCRPFSWWGLDVIGRIDPPSSKGHQFILADTEYFSKWAEAVPLKHTRTQDVIELFKEKIIYRYGVPGQITSDNGSYFKSEQMAKFCKQHGIKHLFSTPHYPQANGQAEAFNKTIVRILKRTADKNKRRWHERPPEALWAYRTTHRTATGATPYSLVFGEEAVLPLEIQVPSCRIAMHDGLTDDEQARWRFEELNDLDEKRLQAKQRIELYQARMAKAYNRAVRYRTFKPGDLVLKVRSELMSGGDGSRSKFGVGLNF